MDRTAPTTPVGYCCFLRTPSSRSSSSSSTNTFLGTTDHGRRPSFPVTVATASTISTHRGFELQDARLGTGRHGQRARPCLPSQPHPTEADRSYLYIYENEIITPYIVNGNLYAYGDLPKAICLTPSFRRFVSNFRPDRRASDFPIVFFCHLRRALGFARYSLVTFSGAPSWAALPDHCRHRVRDVDEPFFRFVLTISLTFPEIRQNRFGQAVHNSSVTPLLIPPDVGERKRFIGGRRTSGL